MDDGHAAAPHDGAAALQHAGEQQLPLAELYGEAQGLAAAARAARTAPSTAAALAALGRCEAAVERAALFSDNEDLDDLATSSLKYLLLPWARAELLSGAPCAGGPEARARAVGGALAALREFLTRAAQYGALKGTAAVAAGVGGDGDGDADGGGGGVVVPQRAGGAAGGAGGDAGARRLAKIERFKRQRALAAAAEQLRKRREDAARRGGGGDSGGDEGGGGGGAGGWDEEDERRLWLMQLEGSALEAIDMRDSLLQEVQLLRHAAVAAAAAPGGDGGRSESGRGASTSGGGGGGAERDARARPGARRPGAAGGGGAMPGTFVIGAAPEGGAAAQAVMMSRLTGIVDSLSLNQRDSLRQQVFQPYVPLPTISVEQQGMMELAAARERDAASAAANAARAAADAGRRSDDEDEDEVRRARTWDDFKDDNPSGWGNSKLRPCA
ncbi:MAG: TAP42-like protein [Monoraphidium minutum]|nr:MAG: TAP42-like protein [Monoraphidium minutum]